MSPRSLLALAAAIVVAIAPVAHAAPAKTAADYDLIEAAYAGQLPRVQQLLAAGASVEAQDQNGYTALHWSAQAGWPLTSKALLAKGATVDARDNMGRTPLLLATVRKHTDVARVLLGAGADPNLKDRDGNSALDYARRKKLTQMVALFMDPGRELRLPTRPSVAAIETPHPVAHATPTPRPTPRATPSPRPTPKPTPRPTPRPTAKPHPTPAPHHATPAPHHATPAPHATPGHHPTPAPRVTPGHHPTPAPHGTPGHHPTPAPTTAVPAAGDVPVSAGFRDEIGRLYGLYTDHLGMRDPENLKQKGFNQELEDKLEQIFHTLDYGSAPALSRLKLHDARAWVIAARKRGLEPDAEGDKVCNQLLESLDTLLSGIGF